ncbi:hypothetical protein [Streptomyces sp. 6N223]|uniref:hypothetical protein n=1 Tax=Streptomyces sp. 6N223 TaxID=3457412 RepID=UPI003FD591CB
MTTQFIFEDRSWNPRVANIRLTESWLEIDSRNMPLSELNAAAMADAYLRGFWLGGGGSERHLSTIPADTGVVPLIRITGSSRPVRTRRAAEFAQRLGELMVRTCGGPEAVAAHAQRAAAEGVPLWITRRYAQGPAGPVTVTVDRRLVRADVWGPGAPAIRLRGPYGTQAGPRTYQRLTVTVGEAQAQLGVVDVGRKSRRSVALQTAYDRWELWRRDHAASRLTRNGHPVAVLGRPSGAARSQQLVLPLAHVWHESDDPLDAVMAHFFAVCFGLGDGTGRVRFGRRRQLPEVELDITEFASTWERSWHTGLGHGSYDSGPGGSGDGWSGDGGGGDGGGFGGGGDGGGGGGGGDGGGGGGGGGD